jgi:ATP/maltotriose-dependent transcriptional regulator MalT
MRSKQTLAVIEEEMLAFTRQETNELFGSYGLSAEQATVALDHSNGRAAALTALAETLNVSGSKGYGNVTDWNLGNRLNRVVG